MPRFRFRGFTLVEVLTVLVIMTVLITAGAKGIGNINAGKGVTSAVATAESLFEQARSIAMAKNCKARVLVDVDDRAGNEANYLRRIIIVHEEIGPDGVAIPNSWIQPNRAYLMPNGVFYSQTYSTSVGSETLAGANIKADFQGTYDYYEFNSEGIATQAAGATGANDPRSTFVVGSGVLRAGAANPTTTASASKDLSGFAIWRSGSSSLFRSPDQIPNIPASGIFTF